MNNLPLLLFDGPLAQLLLQFSQAFPKMIAAGSVLLIGWIIARIVRKVLKRVLAGIGIDKLAERLNDIDMVQNSGMQVKISGVLSETVYYVLMLIFIIAATDLLGVAAITQLVTDLLNYLPALFSAALVFLFGLFVADMIKKLVLTTLESIGVPSAKMIASAVFYFLFITIAVSALAQARINTDFIASNLTIIIGAGALAFAVGYGLAARDLVSNYLASLYNRNKVRVGDEVVIDGVRGKVVLIDNTSIYLQTDDRSIIIPLSKLTSQRIEVFYPDPSDTPRIEGGNRAE